MPSNASCRPACHGHAPQKRSFNSANAAQECGHFQMCSYTCFYDEDGVVTAWRRVSSEQHHERVPRSLIRISSIATSRESEGSSVELLRHSIGSSYLGHSFCNTFNERIFGNGDRMLQKSLGGRIGLGSASATSWTMSHDRWPSDGSR
jgi:hypothetical protein